MGVSFKGLTARGLSIRGQEFLLPTDISGLRNWFKWKEGITVDGSNNVSQWDDSGGSDNLPLLQASATLRPSYDSASGRIRGDGVNDYMRTAALPLRSGIIEFTIVMERATGNGIVLHRTRSTSIDTDGIIMRCSSAGTLSKNVAVGTGSVMTSVAGVVPSATKTILSFRMNDPQQMFVNGVEVVYATRSSGNTHNDTANPRLCIFARDSNGGGVPNVPDTYSDTGIYEICVHANNLTTLQRTKLVNYFKVKHGII